MTGPEHYREAEELLAYAQDKTEYGSDIERYHLAAAQVHATLALAAATATSLADHPAADWDDWRPIASRSKRPGD